MASNASGGLGPFSPEFMAACDGQLKTQFEVAQILAERFKISREDMDEFALESHRRAAATVDSGAVADELVPVPIKDAEGRETGELLEHDEGIRRGGTMESLAALPSAASWDPTLAPDITAGNSSQMSDGAAAMLIADRRVADAARTARASRVPPHGRRRRRRRARAVRAEPGHPQAARPLRHDHRRLRRDRVQRSVRRHRAHVGPRVRTRSGALQPRAAARSRSAIRSVRAASG